MSNHLCEQIGIRYPIILGGMSRVGTAPLAAAVSNAGGLGILGSAAWNRSELKEQIAETRHLTDRPFGVNVPVRTDHADELVETVIAEKIPVITTSAGNPRRYTSDLKRHGVYVMHVVPSAELAVKADKAGVNAVIAEGVESGGMTSRAEISTLALVPRVVDAVSCPVVAAGGFGDGRGLVTALALGAVGIQMGTLFLATEECEVSPLFKQILVLARESDTVLHRREIDARRTISKDLVNEATKTINKDLPDKVSPAGDTELTTRGCGQVVGLIRKIRPVGDVVAEIIADANRILPAITEVLPAP